MPSRVATDEVKWTLGRTATNKSERACVRECVEEGGGREAGHKALIPGLTHTRLLGREQRRQRHWATAGLSPSVPSPSYASFA